MTSIANLIYIEEAKFYKLVKITICNVKFHSSTGQNEGLTICQLLSKTLT